MKSDPQLRQDIRDMQAKILQLEAALAKAKAAEPKERVVEKRVYVDRPVTIEKVVKVPVEKIVTVEKRVTVPVEKVVTVEKVVKVPVDVIREVEKRVPVVEYRDSHETLKALERARHEIDRLRANPRVVEKIVTKPVEVIREIEKPVKVVEYRDTEKTTKALAKALGQIEKLKAAKPKERVVEKVVEIDAPRDVVRVVKVPTPDPALLARVAELQAEISVLRRAK